MTHVHLAAVCALSVAALGVPLRWALGTAGFVDRPNERSSHSVPTVRGGGVAFVVVTLGAALLGARQAISLPWVFAAALLAIVSFVDDARGLSARGRLTVQTTAALLPAWMALDAFSGQGIGVSLGLAVLAMVGTVGLTNAVNFMDGIDGIAAFHGVIASTSTALLLGRDGGSPFEHVAWSLAGALLGFLPWNFPTARMFMGDVGSAFLGYTAAVLAVVGVTSRGLNTLPAFALVHLGFVLDTAITLVRRARRGDALLTPHREHFYQRAVRAGASHRAVTATYAAVTLLSAVASQFAYVGGRVAVLAVVVVTLCWTFVFAAAERRFALHQRASGDAGVYHPPSSPPS